jgi:hypothetical protein
VHGAPETADGDNIQHFMIMQGQAGNFDKNAKLTEERKHRVESLGAFREAFPNGGRSFKPAFGPVRKLKEVEPGGLHVIDEEGNKALLKRVQGVKATSEEPKAIFPTKIYERKPDGQRAKRPTQAMTKPIPQAASRIFAEPPGLSEPSRPTAASPSLTTVAKMHPIDFQKATYIPKRTMGQIQADAAEKRKQRLAATAAEKARMAQIRLDSKAPHKQIHADYKERLKQMGKR